MHTLSFQASEEINQRVNYFAKALDRSKGYLIRQALEQYLHDLDDYMQAKEYKESYNPEENIPFEEIKREFNLK